MVVVVMPVTVLQAGARGPGCRPSNRLRDIPDRRHGTAPLLGGTDVRDPPGVTAEATLTAQARRLDALRALGWVLGSLGALTGLLGPVFAGALDPTSLV